MKSTSKSVAAASLILAMLARVPFADALLLHDHSDHGIHSHAVTFDDVRKVDPSVAWHGHHHEDDDEQNNDSASVEFADPWFIFVGDPAIAARIHGSASAVIGSIPSFASTVLSRSMLSDDLAKTGRFFAASWHSAQPLRAGRALDTLLQTSHALLL